VWSSTSISIFTGECRASRYREGIAAIEQAPFLTDEHTRHPLQQRGTVSSHRRVVTVTDASQPSHGCAALPRL
jgi:hypothetical protein